MMPVGIGASGGRSGRGDDAEEEARALLADLTSPSETRRRGAKSALRWMSDNDPPFESYDQSVAGQNEWEDLQEIAVGLELQRVLARLRLGRFSAALARMGIDTLADVGKKTPNALITTAGLSPAECHALLSELLVGTGRPVSRSGQWSSLSQMQDRSTSPEKLDSTSAERPSSPSGKSIGIVNRESQSGLTFDTFDGDETEWGEHMQADVVEHERRLAEIEDERAERQRIAARLVAQRAEQDRIAKEKAEQERRAARRAQRDRLAAQRAKQEEALLAQQELEDAAAGRSASSPRRNRAPRRGSPGSMQGTGGRARSTRARAQNGSPRQNSVEDQPQDSFRRAAVSFLDTVTAELDG